MPLAIYSRTLFGANTLARVGRQLLSRRQLKLLGEQALSTASEDTLEGKYLIAEKQYGPTDEGRARRSRLESMGRLTWNFLLHQEYPNYTIFTTTSPHLAFTKQILHT